MTLRAATARAKQTCRSRRSRSPSGSPAAVPPPAPLAAAGAHLALRASREFGVEPERLQQLLRAAGQRLALVLAGKSFNALADDERRRRLFRQPVAASGDHGRVGGGCERRAERNTAFARVHLQPPLLRRLGRMRPTAADGVGRLGSASDGGSGCARHPAALAGPLGRVAHTGANHRPVGLPAVGLRGSHRTANQVGAHRAVKHGRQRSLRFPGLTTDAVNRDFHFRPPAQIPAKAS